MAAYGLVLTAPLPMVGTYHRAGVSRWVPVLKPLAELVGRRMQIRVAVSEAARQTGLRSGGGDFEVLFNGVEMERFESAAPRARRGGPTGGAVPRSPRTTQGPERPPRCLCHARAARRPVGGRRRAGHRGAAAAVPRVGSGALAGPAERRRGGRPTGRGRRALRAFAAGRVLRHGAPRGHGGGLRRGGLRHRGLPHRRRAATPPSCPPATPARSPARWAAPWPTPSKAWGSPRWRRARRPPSTPGPGRWTPWPSGTSTSTRGPSAPPVRRAVTPAPEPATGRS